MSIVEILENCLTKPGITEVQHSSLSLIPSYPGITQETLSMRMTNKLFHSKNHFLI